ncbi:MAG TPA: bifunctional diaminohydroxyphosphoribosylaminopyrimidine deaminase/5-amino-6-(5-phosphoribosylamino)uracil reductase RibD [Thermoguttaceae bacterium]|nr:bifunctional diaminohydroxyphosphoribosylaminopyrimidine deaminase/5-amino-6-(5-phosphoribosylamino)uracil reductase RibD [Thermoguttaceae bacterium]
MNQRELDRRYMERALELARLGQGWVEPNPMVGCVIAHGPEVVGEGWHQRFGGAHAEVEALREAGQRARGATLYVTLEPCCHQGKTPPCTEAILAAGVQRVVAAMKDPFPQVAGQGLRRLAEAGLEVHCGLLEAEARRLNAPYLKLIQTGRPWVIAKWAMTLDGKLATRTGQSRWISGPESRALVHQLRGRVDAVLVGSRTAALDDPLLTARPPGPRTAVRIVVDGRARLASESQLVRTARQAPVLVAAGPEAAAVDLRRLESAGCEVFVAPGQTPQERLLALLDELGRRRMTNLLVEGGGRLLGALLDLRAIDEVHVFIAPKLFGGLDAPTPLAGLGIDRTEQAVQLDSVQIERVGQDIYVTGRVRYPAEGEGPEISAG